MIGNTIRHIASKRDGRSGEPSLSSREPVEGETPMH
jgi:hypothetical protein